MPRREHDFYETPPHYLEALSAYLSIGPGARVIDPCVGEGAIAKWVKREFGVPRVVTNDIDPKRKADYHMDAREAELYEDGCEWWITNPPFNIIDDILYTALEHVPNVVTLARLSALEPTKGVGKSRGRRLLYETWQPDMLIVLPRYCFRLNDKGKPATDNMTCCWIGWGPEVPRITTVWTEEPPKEKRRKAA